MSAVWYHLLNMAGGLFGLRCVWCGKGGELNLYEGRLLGPIWMCEPCNQVPT